MPKPAPVTNEPSSLLTSPTLLGKLRANPQDPVAWTEFVRRYGPKIYDWCRRWKLQDADAHDVTQMVLLRFARKLPEFEYDPQQSFRALLKTLTKYAWLDTCERHRKAIPGWGEVEEVAARNELQQALEEEFDRELLDRAMIQVARRVQPKTWDAFRLTAIEGLSGQEAANRLGMKVTALYVAKSSVMKMLQEEVRRLSSEQL